MGALGTPSTSVDSLCKVLEQILEFEACISDQVTPIDQRWQAGHQTVAR